MLSRVVLIATQSLAHVRIFFLSKFHQFSTIWQYFLVVYFIIINFLTHLPLQLLFFSIRKSSQCVVAVFQRETLGKQLKRITKRWKTVVKLKYANYVNVVGIETM